MTSPPPLTPTNTSGLEPPLHLSSLPYSSQSHFGSLGCSALRWQAVRGQASSTWYLSKGQCPLLINQDCLSCTVATAQDTGAGLCWLRNQNGTQSKGCPAGLSLLPPGALRQPGILWLWSLEAGHTVRLANSPQTPRT